MWIRTQSLPETLEAVLFQTEKPNPRHTGKLPGVLPLHVGMRFTLYNCKDCVRLGLMNGAEVELLEILFAPPEWDGTEPRCAPGDLNVLRYMPQALLLRALAASWTLPTQCQLPQLAHPDRTGVFLLKPVTANFVYKDPASPGRSFRITRTTFSCSTVRSTRCLCCPRRNVASRNCRSGVSSKDVSRSPLACQLRYAQPGNLIGWHSFATQCRTSRTGTWTSALFDPRAGMLRTRRRISASKAFASTGSTSSHACRMKNRSEDMVEFCRAVL